jgi:hypothetical protein
VRRVGAVYRDPRHDMAQYVLRRAFLRKVDEIAPGVCRDLLDSVFSAYRNASSTDHLFVRWNLLSEKRSSFAKELREALRAWGRRHNLTDDWLFDIALRTLSNWQEWEEATRERGDSEDPWHPTRPSSFADPLFVDIACGDFRFRHDAWVPTWEPWQEYHHAARAKFEEALRQYREEQERIAKQGGFVLSPEKREIERHLEWLVRFQVTNWTYKKIVDENTGRRAASLDIRGVQRAVHDAAELLGLTLRTKPHTR